MENYDIIGDIHGFVAPLKALLAKLGYTINSQGYYSHPNRKVIFLGDFIDRGDTQKEVLEIVMQMVKYKSALAIMGNHEFNALAYHARHPVTDKPLRTHSDNHNNQHQAFLDTYQNNPDELQRILEWFKTLPLFLELPELRVIHACWNQQAIDTIKPILDKQHCLNNQFLIDATDKTHPYNDIIEILLKGMEIDLPEGVYFKDSYGYARSRIRIKWWSTNAKTYQDYALVAASAMDQIPQTLLTEQQKKMTYADTEIPVFFGHYWFSGQPNIQKNNVACLDYSIAKKGKLVAYCWNQGDGDLSNERFVWVD